MNVVRAIAGVVVGYIAIVIVIFAAFSVAFMILGAEGSYTEPGSWVASGTWVIMSFIVGLIAAMIGGLVAALIAVRNSRAPLALAGLVLVLGLIMGVMQMNAEPPAEKPVVRPDDVTLTQATMYSEQPAIATWLNPFIGAVGVLIGARLLRRGGSTSASKLADGAVGRVVGL